VMLRERDILVKEHASVLHGSAAASA